MSLYRAYVPQALQLLQNLDGWLQKAETHAKELGYDPSVLLAARLYPDQYPLYRQVQSACDSAKFVPARLTGRDAPKHEDGETTLGALRERIASVRAFVEGFSKEEIDAQTERRIVLPFNKKLAARGEDYVHQFGLPNLYFHVTTSYAILRHNGVPLGKTDYIGFVTTEPAA